MDNSEAKSILLKKFGHLITCKHRLKIVIRKLSKRVGIYCPATDRITLHNRLCFFEMQPVFLHELGHRRYYLRKKRIRWSKKEIIESEYRAFLFELRHTLLLKEEKALQFAVQSIEYMKIQSGYMRAIDRVMRSKLWQLAKQTNKENDNG